MSVLTEVLKLFKYDPATDGDMTFNIGQCMNDNWDKLDAAILLAIAAAGAYNPEESYAVGDYCTYKGKLRKCSTAIPTGETWTEAHWTTTTVAAELAELSSQLSNRAAIADTTALGFGPTPAVVSAGSCKNLGQGKYVVYSSVEDLPYESVWLMDVTIHPSLPYKIVKAVDISSSKSGDEWKLLEKNGVWGEWVKFVTATPPQEFDLPLAMGATAFVAGYKNTYSKDQFGIVRVWFSIHFDTLPAVDSIIFTLPAGFRPNSVCCFSALLSMLEHFCASISIYPDGTARVNHGTIAQTGEINLDGFIEFPAGA